MFGMVRILWISLRRPDGHPAWCHAGGRGLVWVQCSGPVVVLYIYNYSYIFLIIQGKWQQNVTDRLAAEWFPASNLHSERLPVAGAAPADCPDFPGELHGTHRPPSHRGSNCLQDPASMRDVVSTCFMFQNLCLTLLSLIHFNLSFYVDATQCPFDAVGMLLGARLLDPSSLSRKTV